MFLTAFYGLWVTYDKTVTWLNVTGFNRFWSVAVRLWVYYHFRQPVAVPVTQNWAEKLDLTGLLNTNSETDVKEINHDYIFYEKWTMYEGLNYFDQMLIFMRIPDLLIIVFQQISINSHERCRNDRVFLERKVLEKG